MNEEETIQVQGWLFVCWNMLKGWCCASSSSRQSFTNLDTGDLLVKPFTNEIVSKLMAVIGKYMIFGGKEFAFVERRNKADTRRNENTESTAERRCSNFTVRR